MHGRYCSKVLISPSMEWVGNRRALLQDQEVRSRCLQQWTLCRKQCVVPSWLTRRVSIRVSLMFAWHNAAYPCCSVVERTATRYTRTPGTVTHTMSPYIATGVLNVK